MVYGKYGYYFKCDACAGNTPLGLIHPSSGEKLRVRKQGRAFYAEREQDDFSVLFFTNPPAANERRTP